VFAEFPVTEYFNGSDKKQYNEHGPDSSPAGNIQTQNFPKRLALDFSRPNPPHHGRFIVHDSTKFPFIKNTAPLRLSNIPIVAAIRGVLQPLWGCNLKTK
jgi:hypothetical protein